MPKGANVSSFVKVDAGLPMTDFWTKWEGQVINGVFPLRRLLGASDHSAVFLTEYKTKNIPNAALKLVAANATAEQAQLSRWAAAAALSHPHLIRLLGAGRCQLGDLRYLFVVMECAEQTLAQVLPHRALTTDEVREMLLPTLGALAFLHGKNLVQGQLKPTNILVIDDQLKMASDTVQPAGESAAGKAKLSVYDPPEARDGRISPAGDIWSLGITLVEALTQHPPSWSDGTTETVSLPAELPASFAKIVRQCLDRNPALRPTAADVLAEINPAPQPIPAPLKLEVPVPAKAEPRRLSLSVLAIAVLFAAVAAVWAGLHWFGSETRVQRAPPPAATLPSTAAAPSTAALPSTAAAPFAAAAPSTAAAPHSATSPHTSPPVLHEEIPEVSPRARATIRGHIKITVRVVVDRAGNVIGENLEKRGPSKYFARLSAEAAKKWKFAPTDDPGSRNWLLQFEFTRGGVTGRATAPSR